ncbi:MAG: S9 family peptidase [Saprospiraceae bacterium]|nr:S9 family peptidase [Saprospiraceae bacterium]
MYRQIIALILVLVCTQLQSQIQKQALDYLDVFELEYANNPQISPDGKLVVYQRTGFDIMTDKKTNQLWLISVDGKINKKLTSRDASESQATWSPSGDRIAFTSSSKHGSEIYVYWMDGGQIAKITQLEKSPSNLAWSPDEKHIAFTMTVPAKAPVIVKGIKKPKGAKWAETPRITDRLKHEADGQGYIDPGFSQIFVVPSNGGTARQLSSGDYQHRSSLSWTPNSASLLFSANRSENWEYDFRNSEVYSIDVQSKKTTALTDRNGPDYSPVVSPDGKKIAYLSYEDKVQAYQIRQLHIMDIDGSNKRLLSKDLDRSVSGIAWDQNSASIYFSYDDKGNTKVATIDTKGNIQKIIDNLGGTSLGRPYAGGSYSVSTNGTIAFTYSTPAHPAEVSIFKKGSRASYQITDLNSDLLDYRELGKVEEVWYTSSFDQRDIQGWIVYPPGYDKTKKYPMMVENHGGPILNYGDRFSTEIQLYAAKGYVVFYPNPRGSTSYGEEFGNLLYNNYPGQDYNDVMDGVNELIKMGVAHEDQLYVTGGSAGGIMTAWMIGKNNRFEAAVVAKPVMNWISKTLVADNYYGYANSRYPGQPWENFEGYWKFSPISLVGNVQTPTMVMVGMNDLRTPPSEAKQLYHALKLRKIETVLVEIPGASHGIARRPSQLITKVAHTIAWFDQYRNQKK